MSRPSRRAQSVAGPAVGVSNWQFCQAAVESADAGWVTFELHITAGEKCAGDSISEAYSAHAADHNRASPARRAALLMHTRSQSILRTSWQSHGSARFTCCLLSRDFSHFIYLFVCCLSLARQSCCSQGGGGSLDHH